MSKQKKLRILFNTEASFLSTGYSRYSHEILKRLHESEKYEVAELGSYAEPEDPRCNLIPWKFYPNLPQKGDKRAWDEYNSNPMNQFNKWRFEHSTIDFKSHVSISARDNWYDNYMAYSPFRHLYKLYWMPTCDAIWQKPEWIEDCVNTDGCFTYTDWAAKVLKYQSNGKIKLLGRASPGADFNVFKVIGNKEQIKQSFKLPPDSIIIGTTMRNQKRKLYPDLFEAFSALIQDESLKDRLYLYVHTTWPDLGWNIPQLIKEYGISNRVLLTYTCRACQTAFSSLYRDAKCICVKCGANEAYLVNSSNPVSSENLNIIYNLMDIYVQYAVCEGFGMPVVEAAAAGIPTMCVDYSGMEDFKSKLNSIPIDYVRLNCEAETGRYFAVPDAKDFIRKIKKLIKFPSQIRAKLGFESRLLAQKNYNWDVAAQKWMDVFDTIDVNEAEALWQSPPKIFHQPGNPVPENLSNEAFVRWCVINICGDLRLVNSYTYLKMIRDLNWGYAVNNFGGGIHTHDEMYQSTTANFRQYSRQDVINELSHICNFNNHWESERGRRMNKS